MKMHTLAALLSLFSGLAPLTASPLPQDSAQEQRILAHSLVNAGNPARIQHLFARAKKGEPITVAVIGGSITAGASATKPELRYANRLAQWFKSQFPKSQITLVNAGIGATGSNYGALRAQRDLLSKKPDFVVVEYAVNDPNSRDFSITLEGLLRQILSQPQQPGVVLMFMMNNGGANAQEWHSKVGEHYGIPMLSYRDALWPEISGHSMALNDVFADQVHPNDRGHGYVAAFITNYLDSVLKQRGKARMAALPAPLFSDIYQHTHLYYGKELQAVVNSGWHYDSAGDFWAASTPGSVLEADVEGREVNVLAFRIKGPMGRARVQVDATSPVTLEGWFDQTWGGYTFTEPVAKELAPGKHHVKIEVLSEKAAGSTGTEFRVFGLGSAG
jgi:lysophospholipase L1-like esterase